MVPSQQYARESFKNFNRRQIKPTCDKRWNKKLCYLFLFVYFFIGNLHQPVMYHRRAAGCSAPRKFLRKTSRAYVHAHMWKFGRFGFGFWFWWHAVKPRVWRFLYLSSLDGEGWNALYLSDADDLPKYCSEEFEMGNTSLPWNYWGSMVVSGDTIEIQYTGRNTLETATLAPV